jgi:hypothetical protein
MWFASIKVLLLKSFTGKLHAESANCTPSRDHVLQCRWENLNLNKKKPSVSSFLLAQPQNSKNDSKN